MLHMLNKTVGHKLPSTTASPTQQTNRIAALQHKLDGKMRAYATAVRKHTATAATLTARKTEVQALQLKLHPENAARKTTARKHTLAAAFLTQQEERGAAKLRGICESCACGHRKGRFKIRVQRKV